MFELYLIICFLTYYDPEPVCHNQFRLIIDGKIMGPPEKWAEVCTKFAIPEIQNWLKYNKKDDGLDILKYECRKIPKNTQVL